MASGEGGLSLDSGELRLGEPASAHWKAKASPVEALRAQDGRRSFAGARPMKHTESVIQSDPEIMGGTPVFVGTRVPFQTLLDYLEGGQPLAEFLDDFPTVSRDQAVAALEQAKEALLARARPA
jgi:uncharacterized protein (DUF433 family)